MPQLVEWVGEDRKGFSRKTTRPAHLRLIYLFYSVFLPASCTSVEAPQSQVEEYPFASPGVIGRSRPISSVLHRY